MITSKETRFDTKRALKEHPFLETEVFPWILNQNLCNSHENILIWQSFISAAETGSSSETIELLQSCFTLNEDISSDDPATAAKKLTEVIEFFKEN